MEKIYTLRNRRYFSKQMRYMKYVLNDHFVLVTLFLLGGVGYYYSNFVKTLPHDFVFSKLFLCVSYLLLLIVGKNVLLFEPADKTFLIAQETNLSGYLKNAFVRSLFVPFFLSGLITLFFIPLFLQTYLGFVVPVVIGIMFVAYKILLQKLVFQNYYLSFRPHAFQLKVVLAICAVLSFALSLFIQIFLGVIPLVAAIVFFVLKSKEPLSFFDWEKVIALEQERMTNLLKFYSMFTDVPGVAAKVRRRKVFDPLIQKLEQGKNNPYFSLYIRAFFRGGEYGSLYLRLLVISLILMFFVSNGWILLGLGCLFIYLIGFQLIPLVHQFDYMILPQLYPISPALKSKGIQGVLQIALSVQCVFYSAMSFWMTVNLQEGMICVAGFVIFAFLFLKLYVPSRLKKVI